MTSCEPTTMAVMMMVQLKLSCTVGTISFASAQRYSNKQASWRNSSDLYETFSGTGCDGPEAPAGEKRAWLSSAHPCVKLHSRMITVNPFLVTAQMPEMIPLHRCHNPMPCSDARNDTPTILCRICSSRHCFFKVGLL